MMRDCMYIDLDNMYSCLLRRDDLEIKDISKTITRIVKQVFKMTGKEAIVKVFGNFSYLPKNIIQGSAFGTREWLFYDTPYINRHFKTAADGFVHAEIFRDSVSDHVNRFILLTSDLDFYPISEALVENGNEVFIVSCGHVSPHLVKSCSVFIPVMSKGTIYHGKKTPIRI